MLKPIPGAPVGAPVPDFPMGNPTDRPATQAEPPPTPERADRARRPTDISGRDGRTLQFRVSPEIPAITRASLSISVVAGAAAPRTLTDIKMSADRARTFLQGLREGQPVVAVDDRDFTIQIEFTVADEVAAFIIGKRGDASAQQRFTPNPSNDLKAMADQLLADLGPA
jgi:hypothetical protein